MMRPARFPRIAAWLVVLLVVGVVTLGALQGLHALEPSAPHHLEHMRGVIVSLRGNDTFALREPQHAGLVWFRVARGSHISFAHLQRHFAEKAPTDVFYQDQKQGTLLAWLAD